VYATLLVLTVVVIALAHVAEKRSQREEALERLGSVTSTLAAQLNGDHVTLLLEKYREPGLVIKSTQDAWYYVLHDHLRRSAERIGLEQPLRIVAYDSLRRELQTVVTSDTKPDFRGVFTDGAEKLLAGYAEGGRTRMGGKRATDLVAFDALRDDRGHTTGIVVGIVGAAEADTRALALLWRNILIAAVLLALAGLALFRSVGQWLRHDADAHDALERKHAGVTDSIAYAGKIQRALVPAPKVYEELFAGAFVIDRPKDTVSGDFHWAHRIDEDTCFVAAADCTGHGLPGAMMAAIGCSLLNEIVPRHADKDPAELLGMLNTRLVTTLHQQGRKRGAGDGMDLALCRVDRRRREILFAGAFRPLYWSHRGRLTVINGDRRPIGGSHQELDRRYTCHRLAYHPGDRIYLFSDGYTDQAGGPEGKRFMSTRLHALLTEHRDLPMGMQAELLDRAFLEWKGDRDQVDDVCMLGLAV